MKQHEVKVHSFEMDDLVESFVAFQSRSHYRPYLANFLFIL